MKAEIIILVYIRFIRLLNLSVTQHFSKFIREITIILNTTLEFRDCHDL